MTNPQVHQKPVITAVVLVTFLIINAQTLQVAGWALAFIYTVWQVLTRSDEIGIPFALADLLAFPFYILLVGLHGFYAHPMTDVAKDCWYFLAPLVYVSFGFFVAERLNSVKSLVYLFSAAGVALSLQSLWQVYQNGSTLLSAATAEGYRHVLGIGAGQAMIPVVLIVMCRQSGIDLGIIDSSRPLRYFILTTGSLAILLALSRTLLFVLLLGVALAVGRKFFVVLALIGVFILVVPQAELLMKPAASQSFVGKIMHGGEEVQLHPYSSMAQINENWRGFEGYRALEAYSELSPLEHVVGGGFGTLVDLGFTMNLGGPKEVQEIPILHNGYLYLLVKTGLAGLGLFGAFVVLLFKRGRRLLRERQAELRLSGYLFIWSSLTIFLTQAVITGIYNKGALAPNLMLLGVAGALCLQPKTMPVRSSMPFSLSHPEMAYAVRGELQ